MLPDTEQFPQSRGSLLRFAALEGLGAAQDGIAYFDNMGIVDGSGCFRPLPAPEGGGLLVERNRKFVVYKAYNTAFAKLHART